MNWIGWILLGLFLGVIIGFKLKKATDVYNFEIKRNKARKNGKIDLSQINNLPSEKEKIRKYIINDPEKDRKKLFKRLKFKNRKHDN